MTVQIRDMVRFEWESIEDDSEVRFILPGNVHLIAKIKDEVLDIRNSTTGSHKTAISVRPQVSNVVTIEGVAL